MSQKDEEIIKKDHAIIEHEKTNADLENKLKMLEEKINIHHNLEYLLGNNDYSEEREQTLKDTIADFMKKPDGNNSLCAFIFVLHQKIRGLQEELDQGKNVYYNI